MKYSLLGIATCFVFLMSFSPTFSSEDTGACEKKEWYELYTCRINQICEVYKPEKPIFKKEKYTDAKKMAGEYIGSEESAPALWEAKRIYRANMWSTYKCVMVQSQKNALEIIKKQLKTEKSGKIDDTIGRQIEQRINRLDLTVNTLKCSLTEKEDFTVKAGLLKELTYEMCHYVNYLEYLNVYYSDTNNTLWLNDEWVNTLYEEGYNVTHIPELIGGIQGEISKEISHTYKVFPLVFHAYSEYENNFPIHFLLEVIHADFVLLKQKMYETLMPIAQVGYKIINAMSQ